MHAELEFMDCPICGQETAVEALPCLDGHGADCPERVCTLCGYALTIAPAPRTSRPAARRRAA